MDKATYIKGFHDHMNWLTAGTAGNSKLYFDGLPYGDYFEVDLFHYNGETAIFWFKGGATIEYDIFEGKFTWLVCGNADPDDLMRGIRELVRIVNHIRSRVINGFGVGLPPINR